MTVPVQASVTGFIAGAPVPQLTTAYMQAPAIVASRSYDVAPDGQRFLMLRQSSGVTGASRPRLVVALNWFEELKTKLAQK